MSSNQAAQIKYLGVDTGGTFTDFVLFDQGKWRVHKVLSTPDNPAKAILQGISELGLDEDVDKRRLCIVHGSTVATNAVLERKGARTLYIANKGFKDLLTIGRQARKQLYQLKPEAKPPPVPEQLCIEVDTRRDASGNLVTPLDDNKLSKLELAVQTLNPEAVAINLLFSFLNDQEEKEIESRLKERYFVSRSSFVLPRYKEYERGIATWLNASLGPKVQAYMQHLQQGVNHCPVSVMQSSGGTMAIDQAAVRAVNLLLSGPAGGLSAVKHIGEQCGISKLISFDMGGTSTDVALMNGDFEMSDEGHIEDWPVAIPMLNIETIGAGGGSIAWVDPGGMLHTGPQSAGSSPGPACYGRGGEEPCVTDANVYLGRLLPESFLGGRMQLDKQQAQRAIAKVAERIGLDTTATALGIIELAEHQMIQALHRISIKKGHDPSDFALCCFGGAGGLHVCSLAEQLNMKTAIVPRNGGVLSALGMLVAPVKRQLTRTYLGCWQSIDQADLRSCFEQLESEAMTSLKKEHPDVGGLRLSRELEMRYLGQSYTLSVEYQPDAEAVFVQKHKKQYGHTLNKEIELVNISVRLELPSDLIPDEKLSTGSAPTQAYSTTSLSGISQPVPVYDRASLQLNDSLDGPALITETVSTTWLKPNWQAKTDTYGNLILIQK